MPPPWQNMLSALYCRDSGRWAKCFLRNTGAAATAAATAAAAAAAAAAATTTATFATATTTSTTCTKKNVVFEPSKLNCNPPGSKSEGEPVR